MPGILDIFDSPDLLGNLFGIGQANAATPPPQAPPMPPPSVMQGAPPAFSPNSTMGGLASLGGGVVPPPELSFADRAQPVQEAVSNGMMDPQGRNFTSFAPPAPPAPGGRWVQLAGAGPGLPVNDAPPLPPVNGGGSPAEPPGPLAPPPGGPPMPPRLPPNAAPPTMSGGGGLAASLGIPDNRMQQFLAGVGKGASNLQGTGGFANAMRGAGGGITGAQAKETEQVAQKRQAQNDLFNQSSTAFKDMLAADAAGDNSAYKAAQAQYLKARAASLMTGGAGGSKAWQNTPYGKVIQVESKTQQYEKAQQIVLQKQWTLNGATAEQQKEDLEQLKKATDQYRERLYKAIGVAPDQADKLKNMGTAKDNPFDTKGMTLEQFNEQVPMGAWYKDQNGVPRQRVKPPAGMSPPNAAANLDDQDAMAG